ncbi:EpsG family protein [Moraxella sp. TY6]|uniref:EpsG family protein n=2 Tax=unclassified Moraxella TaxID=2685852 RepID=UPI003AF7839C
MMTMFIALDRDNYLFMMQYPFEGREEPLIHIISYLLGFLNNLPSLKLVLLQIFFTTLLLLVIIKNEGIGRNSNFLKVIISFLLFISVFSNMLSVQLRIGYATIIFIFISLFLDKEPKLRNIPYYLLPCLMHMGAVPVVIAYYTINFLKINSYKKFVIVFLLSIGIMTLGVKFLPEIMTQIGINGYYNDYLETEGDFGRAFPFTMFFYFVLILISLFKFESFKFDQSYYFSLFGLVLVYNAIILKLYVSFKMLVPFSAFFTIYLFNAININNQYTKAGTIILIMLLIPLSFFMLITQAGL